MENSVIEGDTIIRLYTIREPTRVYLVDLPAFFTREVTYDFLFVFLHTTGGEKIPISLFFHAKYSAIARTFAVWPLPLAGQKKKAAYKLMIVFLYFPENRL